MRHYYSNSGILLGAFASSALSELLFDFYAVNLNNKKKKSVLSPDGTILVKDVAVLNAGNGRSAVFFADSGGIRLYDLEARAFVLQDLAIRSIQGGTDFGNGAWDCYIIETATGRGIYQAAEKVWLVPLSTHYVKIVYAAVMDYFILKDHAGRYYYFDAVERTLSSAYDYVCASVNHYQDLMLLQGDLLYKKGYAIILNPVMMVIRYIIWPWTVADKAMSKWRYAILPFLLTRIMKAACMNWGISIRILIAKTILF